MAKQKEEELKSGDFIIEDIPMVQGSISLEDIGEESSFSPEPSIFREPIRKESNYNTGGNIPSCLRNERVIVKHVPKETGMVTNPKHILYGGLAENSYKGYTVPQL
jgi:hypothetical protein